MARNKDGEVVTRPRLGPRQKQIVLKHVLRYDSLYKQAVDKLKPEYFDRDTDSILWVVWVAAKRVIQMHCNNSLPDPGVLWSLIPAEIEAMVASNEIAITQEEARNLSSETGILRDLFGYDNDLNEAVGEKLFVNLLSEKMVFDNLLAIANRCSETVPTDISKDLEKLQANDRFIKSLRTSSARTAVPDSLGELGLGKESTGLCFVDRLFAGGDAPKEVYGVMGAFGAGKTTLAIQLCVEKAKFLADEAIRAGTKPRTCHLFFYEASYEEIVRRMWGYACSISRETMEKFNGNNWEIFSTTGSLQPYEEKLFAAEIARYGIENVPGEYERFLIHREALRENIVLHDYSGMNTGDNATYGNGYVDEIAASLRNYVNESGNEVGAVYVDYVLLAARNYMNFKGMREDSLRHLVGGFPSACLRQVAGPFNCCVYLMHQLTGAANGRTFNASFTNADSAESKSFPENVWFNLALSIRDPETGISKLSAVKHRRGPDISPGLLQLEGMTGRFVRADDYVISPESGRPVARQDYATIANNVSLQPNIYQPEDDGTNLDEYED